MASIQEAPIFPFFVGCARSGTTLLRAIFSSHPEMAIPGETHYFSEMLKKHERYESDDGFAVEAFLADLLAHPKFPGWLLTEVNLRDSLSAPPVAGYADAVRRVYTLYARTKGKLRYGDRTPRNVINVLALAGVFPESRFIHIIRDGRDVAMSLMDWRWGARDIVKAALFWRERVERGREAGRILGNQRYTEIRYEELIDDMEIVVKRACRFIGLDFDPLMLHYYDHPQDIIDTPPGGPPPPERGHLLHLPPTRGLRDWRRQMANRDLSLFELVAGDLLGELGYERRGHRPSLRMRAIKGLEIARCKRDFMVERTRRRPATSGR